ARSPTAASSTTAATEPAANRLATPTSPPSTAPPGSSAPVAPASASGSALVRVRFQTRTSWPAANQLRAIAPPMIPVPRTASVMATCLPDRVRVTHRIGLPAGDPDPVRNVAHDHGHAGRTGRHVHRADVVGVRVHDPGGGPAGGELHVVRPGA